MSITNPKGSGAYPISSFTWLLIQPQPRDSAKGAQIKQFITWMLEPEAQRMAADLHYAPLPVPVIELVQKRIAGYGVSAGSGEQGGHPLALGDTWFPVSAAPVTRPLQIRDLPHGCLG